LLPDIYYCRASPLRNDRGEIKRRYDLTREALNNSQTMFTPTPTNSTAEALATEQVGQRL